MAKKWSAWLAMGLVLAGPITTFGTPTGIDLISQEHHVWGSAGSSTQFFPGGTEVSYDQTSSGPLDVSVSGTYMHPFYGEFPLTARSQAGDFRVETQGVYWFSEAYAQSRYVFAPQAEISGLRLQFSGSGYGTGLSSETNVRFALDDLTAGTPIGSLAAPGDPVSPDDLGGWDWPPSTWSLMWDSTYPIDPTHLYAMTLFAYAGGGDAERGALLDVNVQAIVPAPEALFLTAFGAALVGWRRRSTAR